MDKLQMVHEYAKVILEKGGILKPDFLEQEANYIAVVANAVADAVIAKTGTADGFGEWQPDWSKIPEQYDWFAVDEDGQAYCYNFKPYKNELNNHWADHDLNHGDGMASTCSDFGYQGDWRLSLRKRPK